MNSFQCSMCTVAHCFRPISGYNGMKNICPNTDIFFENCEKSLKLGIDVITGMFHNMASEPCLHRGRLMPMMDNHDDELSETEVASVSKFVLFAIQFAADHKYCKSDHGLKHTDLFCLSTWMTSAKNAHSSHFRDLCRAFKDCTTSFQGFRRFTFFLCCTVFTRVRSMENVTQKTFYSDLESTISRW